MKWRTADRHIGVCTEQVSENYKNKMHKWIKSGLLGNVFSSEKPHFTYPVWNPVKDY